MCRATTGYGAVVVLALLLPLALAAQPAVIDVPLVEGEGAELFVDPGSHQKQCFAASLIEGDALPAVYTPVLPPGRYRAVLRLKASHTISEYLIGLRFSLTATANRKNIAELPFRIIRFAEPGVYERVPIDFTVSRPKQVVGFHVTFKWQGKPGEQRPAFQYDAPTPGAGKLADVGKTEERIVLERQLTEIPWHIALGQVTLETLHPVAVQGLRVDKNRYRPEEVAQVSGTLENYTPTKQTGVLVGEIIRGMDEVEEVHRANFAVEAGEKKPFTFPAKLSQALWGHEIRCRLLVDDEEVSRASEYFTVHANPWAVAIGCYGMNLPYYRAGPNGENCERMAQHVKKSYANAIEFVFWAPDDFGDLTPTETPYWGGQLRHQSGAESTRLLIEAFHRAGIACSFYATFTGGGGRAGYDLYRKHPDWFRPAFYDVAQLDRWDRSKEMMSWPRVGVRSDLAAPYLHHGREIIRSAEHFGWDSIRYDSNMGVKAPDTDEPYVAKYFPMVKEMVMKAAPHFRWGYNDALHRQNLKKEPALDKLFSTLCEGGGMIMDEYNNHAFQDGWPYDKYARRHRHIRDMVHARGGHYTLCPGEPKMASDQVYQAILPLVARGHHAWDPQKGGYPYTNYHRFSTRYAGQLWDNQARVPAKAAEMVQWQLKDGALFHWQDYAYHRQLGDGRAELIMHLVNAPPKRVNAYDDGRVPPPLKDLRCTVSLPPGSQASAVWSATTDPAMQQTRLPHQTAGQALTFTIDRVRFWTMVVVQLNGKGEWQ